LSDAKFYTVLVFDTGRQCQAFIDFINVKTHITEHGTGRHIAQALGCELPEPEFELKSQRTDG
jgi:hypothetical protein